MAKKDGRSQMKYLIHFEDGSSAYLCHHGKKGMKWGEWSEETRKKYAANPELIGEYAKSVGLGVVAAPARAISDVLVRGDEPSSVEKGKDKRSGYVKDMKRDLYKTLGLGKSKSDNALVKAVRKWSSYIAESYDNITESGYLTSPGKKSSKHDRSLQKDTDALYGLRGEKAQKKAIRNRKKMYAKIASHF